jgi:LmbE family N-acetylglucosaminyl deacetylase
MPDQKNIVYICAHPDDIYSVAGTLMLLRRKGYTVHDFLLTRGQKGGTQPDIADIRSKEEQAVCAIIGAELRFFDQMDGELFADRPICERVAGLLKELNPAAVITLWPFEKQDHAAAYGIAHKALCMADLRWTTEFYMCSADGEQYRFQPDLYVNITAVIEDVKKVVACYPSQWKPGALEWCIEAKKHYGHQAWCDYAEGFRLPLPLLNERWNRRTEIGRVLMDL